ncbi:hypothetical protein P879_00460 [Paragonimus westermani]|uniref:Cyclin N-terminal domain-containing protein n=1 Tax=Paragonimus westermani TaxID=34504 RepID=A0A8T0DV49_9TREM|nr:hypothetical protein P879_00460 [Paragonimus westermani]
MGNRCSPCCRKTHKSFRENDLGSNYGAATNHLVSKPPGSYRPSYPKDMLVDGYAHLTGGGDPVCINGELRNYQLADAHLKRVEAAALASVNPSGEARTNRYKMMMMMNQPPQGNYVVAQEPSEYMRSSMYAPSSSANLQHISEREPDDTETDPSLNPIKETLFMQRSIRDVEASFRKRRSIYERNMSRNRQRAARLLHRSSSSSTIRLDDSTVSRPDPKSTVRALAHAVYLQIKNRDRRCSNPSLPDIFDERLHPVQNEPVPADYGSQDPDHKVVYRFIRTLFQMAQLSPECAIVTMVYLERLLTSAETELTPATWKRSVLCAILLASKVWDDQAVWNVDYCQILKDLNVNDV